jgi:hypothetical protein
MSADVLRSPDTLLLSAFLAGTGLNFIGDSSKSPKSILSPKKRKRRTSSSQSFASTKKRVKFTEPSVVVAAASPTRSALTTFSSTLPLQGDCPGWSLVKTPLIEGVSSVAPPKKSPTLLRPLTVKTALDHLESNECVAPKFFESALKEKEQDIWYKRIVKDSPLSASDHQTTIRNKSNVVALCVYSEEGMNSGRFEKPLFVKRWSRWLGPLIKRVSSFSSCDFNHIVVENYPSGFSFIKKPRVDSSCSEYNVDLLDPCGALAAPRVKNSKVAVLMLGKERRVKFEHAAEYAKDSNFFRVKGGDLFVFDSASFPFRFRPSLYPSFRSIDAAALLVFELRQF